MDLESPLLLGLSIQTFGQSVSIWQTLADGSQKFQSQTAQSFTSGTAGSTNITINESSTAQTITGFGWTLTEGSCEALSSLGTTQQICNTKRLIQHIYWTRRICFTHKHWSFRHE